LTAIRLVGKKDVASATCGVELWFETDIVKTEGSPTYTVVGEKERPSERPWPATQKGNVSTQSVPARRQQKF
jgi:hypothetical protein